VEGFPNRAVVLSAVALLACSPAPEDAPRSDGGVPFANDGGSETPGDGTVAGDGGAIGCATVDCLPDGSPVAFGGEGAIVLTANQAGRTGADLLVSVTATREARAAFGLAIQLRDQAGSPVVAFPGWSGVPTDSERVVLFDDDPAADAPTRTVTLRGMIRAFPTIRQVEGALASSAGTSTPLLTNLAIQTIRTLGQSCDPQEIATRCSPALTCDRGTAICATANPPSVTRFAYLASPLGGRMLLTGTDPADDLSAIHFEFLTDAGTPVGVDLNGDGNLENSAEEPVTGASALGKFFFAVQSSPTFAGVVAELAATPAGGATGPGSRVTAMLQPTPTAATGEACDARGFIDCVAGDVCVDDACMTIAAAADAAAQRAPVLSPTGTVFATGYVHGANLWGDPPAGCAPVGIRGFPEAIVTLHVASDVPMLTITTDHQETTAGAALFVLTGTGASAGGGALACNSGLPATVTLTNVASGDYTIVIESRTPQGGNFGISVR
jgi:hypothetical protein